jgi:FtsP/CotA-like multicopper oxidase with cupredoxin domain
VKKLIFIILLLKSFVIWADNSPSTPITLKAIEETLTVDGKPSKVFNIIQPNGTEGFIGTKGQYFDVLLKNETHVPISIHWHGLILPNDQDGIPYVTQLPIQPGASKHYHFKLVQAGTFWMHSHFMYHEQELMTAPLIIYDPQDSYKDDKNIIVMLQGFTFTDPEKIFYDLQHSPNGKMNMKMSMSNKPDLNDVVYDAYLSNRRTLQNPDIFKVRPGEKVRLRLINGSSANNFWINTGKLQAKLIAVDGNNIIPIINTNFQIAVAQRIDLEVTIPNSGGAFPILAKVEGLKQQTGFILATSNASIPHLSEEADKAAPALNNNQEFLLHPLHPLLTKLNTISLKYKLTGDMQHYIWKINNEVWPRITSYKIKKGDRVEMVFVNDTEMAHPMHFHGHVFQVTEINNIKINNGPLHDTILVLPHTTEKIIFDANNPGIWMMHCHVLYHMMAGMMTTTNYLDYPLPSYYQDLINGKINAN